MKTAVIVAALNLLAPQMHPGTRALYAKVLRKEGAAYHVDPLLMAAIIRHESRWHADADNGQCVGLGQICLRTQAACAGGLQTPECQARRLQLLDGPSNIHVIAGMLAAWTKKCKELTGHAATMHVVSGYAGVDGHSVYCGQMQRKKGWKDAPVHRVVKEVLALFKRVKR